MQFFATVACLVCIVSFKACDEVSVSNPVNWASLSVSKSEISALAESIFVIALAESKAHETAILDVRPIFEDQGKRHMNLLAWPPSGALRRWFFHWKVERRGGFDGHFLDPRPYGNVVGGSLAKVFEQEFYPMGRSVGKWRASHLKIRDICSHLSFCALFAVVSERFSRSPQASGVSGQYAGNNDESASQPNQPPFVRRVVSVLLFVIVGYVLQGRGWYRHYSGGRGLRIVALGVSMVVFGAALGFSTGFRWSWGWWI